MTTRAEAIEKAARSLSTFLRAVHWRLGSAEWTALRALEDAVDLPPDEPVRLPVIATCGQCADATDDAPSRPGYAACLHHAIGERSLPSLVEPPPSWCPLPKETP